MDISEYQRQVDRAYETTKGAATEQRILALLLQSQKEYGPDSPACASMHSELGGYYRWIGRHEQSETEFRKAVEILSLCGEEWWADRATALNNLAGALRYMGRYEEAKPLFEECLSIYRDTLGEHHILYAAGLNNLSLVYLQQGKLEQAVELQEQAIDILSTLSGGKAELAASLCNLGELYRRMGKLGQASSSLQRALELQETKVGTNSPHYHAILNALGYVYRDLGQKEAACRWFRQAAAAAAAHYGCNHKEYLSALEQLEELGEGCRK